MSCMNNNKSWRLQKMKKYDVVIGNPPFQGNGSGWKLYPKFMKKGMEEAPIVAMVVPNKWLTNNGSKKIRQEMKGGSLICNNDVNHHFPDVSDNIGYFVYNAEEAPYCYLYGREQDIDDFAIDDTHQRWKYLMKKIFTGRTAIRLKKSLRSVNKLELKQDGKHRCYYSRAQWVAGNRYHDKPVSEDYHKEKVIISRVLWSKFPDQWDTYCFVDKDIDGNDWCAYYLPEEDEDAHEVCENIKSFMGLPTILGLFYGINHTPYKCPYMHDVWRENKGTYNIPDVIRKYRWTEDKLKEVFEL